MELIVVGILSTLALAYVAYPLMSSNRDMYYLEDALASGDQKTLFHLRSKKNLVYDNIRDLDNEFDLGKLSVEDHQKLRNGLLAEAAELTSEIDAAEVRRDIEQLIEAEVKARRKG